MSRRLALLLGVAEYEDRAIRPLPFVPDDQARLAAALERMGYKIIPADTGGRLGRTEIKVAVQQFFASAASGDSLLLSLSGHGAHTKGIDYIVPADANTSLEPFIDGCVPIGWEREIEASKAESVLVLIDACREGFDDKTMGLETATKWGKGKLGLVATRRIGYIFACHPGEVARYVSSPEGDFSLFSRALQEIIAEPALPTSLAVLETLLEARMARFMEMYPGRPQRPRVRCETPHEEFPLFAARNGAPEVKSLPWARLVSDSPLWDRVAGMAGTESLRMAAGCVTESASAAWRDATQLLTEDPWRDPKFPSRMLERVEYLLTRILVDATFSPAEISLLVTLPFVQDAYWANEAGEALHLEPWSLEFRAEPPERADLERFFQGFPRLYRRATRSDASSAGATHIAWWMFHRWLGQRASAYRPQAFAPLLREGGLRVRSRRRCSSQRVWRKWSERSGPMRLFSRGMTGARHFATKSSSGRIHPRNSSFGNGSLATCLWSRTGSP